MRHKRYWLILILLILPGCWDLQEIDRRAFATTVGIDRTAQGLVELSLQIPLPQRMLPQSAQSSGKEAGKTFNTIRIKGHTVNEAFARLQTLTYRELVIQQNKSLVVAKSLAQSGVSPYIDYFFRESKAPPQALIYITRRPAREILSFIPTQETLPGLQFFETSQSVVKYDRTYFVPIWFFEQRMMQRTKDAYAPIIDINKEQGQYIQAGLAVFSGDRMVGELSEEEAQIFGLLTGRMKTGDLTFVLPEGEGLSIRNTRGSTRIKVHWNTEEPSISITMNVACAISEYADGRRQITPAYVRRLERIVAQRIKQRTTATIAKLQRFGSDPVGFGEYVRVQHPDRWKGMDWKKTYPKVQLSVRTKVLILTDGVLK